MSESPHAPAPLAWRVFLQGLGIDLAVACTMILAVAVTDIRWTREYWIALGLSLSRTIIQTAVAYLMRRLVAPHLAAPAARPTYFRA